MGLFKRATSTEPPVSSELLRALLSGNGMDGITALEIPAVQGCLTLIADCVSSLPIKLFERTDEGVRAVSDDVRVRMLNGDTGDTLTAMEMRKRWVYDYFLSKGAYTYIKKNSKGVVDGLYYADNTHITVNFNQKPIFKKYDIMVDGYSYQPYEFIKILRNSKGDGVGRSIVDENSLILSVAYNIVQFENVLVKKGGNKKGFLKAKNRIEEKTLAELKQNWRNMYENNSENMIILNDGIDFVESSNTSVEMELADRKQVVNAEICGIFGVPAEMLTGKYNADTKSNFVENAIMPLLNAIESALDTDLLLESEKNSKYYAFDTREITRGDIAKRYEAYAKGLQHNFLQIDEVRELEDLQPLGFNYIKLGLQDVLLNPDTKEIYTANTNAVAKLDDLKNDTEVRGGQGSGRHKGGSGGGKLGDGVDNGGNDC